jgi:quinol monooxygenase YgiN
MVIVLGSVCVEEAHVEQALALSHQHVVRSREEPGCISHAVHLHAENPFRLVFVEEWADQQALFEHFRVPASGDFVRALSELASEAPSMRMFEAEPIAAPTG